MLDTEVLEMKRGRSLLLRDKTSLVFEGSQAEGSLVAIPQGITRGRQTTLQALPSPGKKLVRRVRSGSPSRLLAGLGTNAEWGWVGAVCCSVPAVDSAEYTHLSHCV